MRLKNVQHAPSINKNLISGSLLCRDGFKLVIESNKVVISRFGQFIGKVYDSGGLFRLSLADFCNKVVNNMCDSNNCESDIWHSHLCHISGVLTKGGEKYFTTLIDDATKFCYVYLLKTKDEALDFFKTYKAKVENQLEKKIKRVRSDRGGEYFSNEFDSFSSENGIIHE